MRFVWDRRTQQNFFSQTHRGRYLLSSAAMNPPIDATPLFCIRLVYWKYCSVIANHIDELVLYQVKEPPSFYLAKMSDLIALLGYIRGPQAKLNHAAFLWHSPGDEELSVEKQRLFDEMQRYRLDSTERVYECITRLCSSTDDGVRPTISAGGLVRLFPRPRAMAAASVGTALGEGVSSEPPSRRGVPRNRGKQSDESRGDGVDRG